MTLATQRATQCSLALSQRLLRHTIFPVFDRAWHSRLTRALSLLTSSQFRPRQLRILTLDDLVYSREVDPENARWCVLAQIAVQLATVCCNTCLAG